MQSFDIALPAPLATVEIAETPSPASGAYDRGHHDGYKAGRWLAEHEGIKQRERADTETRETVDRLENLARAVPDIAAEHLPELLMLALERLVKNNPYTHEMIATEVSALLSELRQASRIAVECSEADLKTLKAQVEKASAPFSKSTAVEWKAAPGLEPGEYRIESDLGTVDGRKLTKIAKVRAAVASIIPAP